MVNIRKGFRENQRFDFVVNHAYGSTADEEIT